MRPAPLARALSLSLSHTHTIVIFFPTARSRFLLLLAANSFGCLRLVRTHTHTHRHAHTHTHHPHAHARATCCHIGHAGQVYVHTHHADSLQGVLFAWREAREFSCKLLARAKEADKRCAVWRNVRVPHTVAAPREESLALHVSRHRQRHNGRDGEFSMSLECTIVRRHARLLSFLATRYRTHACTRLLPCPAATSTTS